MKHVLLAGSALFIASSAWAGNLERSNQDVGILFEEGNWGEFSYYLNSPSVSGIDLLGGDTGDVIGTFSLPNLGYKADINNVLSWAVIYDQPYGATTEYGPSSLVLGGTSALADSWALTGLLRYKFNDNYSVHGGLRLQSIGANVELDGLAYGGPPPGGLSGYQVDFDDQTALGWVLGGAYEIPDIALRLAVTYNSAIGYDLATDENYFAIPDNTTDVTTPQSVNIDFQTGVMEDTLVFGSIRWVDWSEFEVAPAGLGAATGGTPLVSYEEDVTTYTLGVGRQFTDEWAGALQLGYESETEPLVSPLGPTNGYTSVGGGVTYTFDNGSELSAGVAYYWVGDATAQVGGTSVATFSDNTAIGGGIKYGMRF